MLATPSADAALPSSSPLSTYSHVLYSSDMTAELSSQDDITTRNQIRTPITTTTTCHDACSELRHQLRCEMQKTRPDHFVIGVTCRSLGGVPSELRPQVWKELLGVARSEHLCLDQSILQVEQNLTNQRVIAADAARTRGNEPRFKEPETVELVVKLLTYYCKSRNVHYKQGMNEVLAPFLLLTEQREGCKDFVPLAEGVVFQCFDALIDKFLPHVFGDEEFKSLQCSFQLYRLLMLYHDPELCHYLDQLDMTPEIYVTPWFMTLLARSLPPEFVFYLWDFFLLEEDPYLLHFVAYALVAANRKRILQAEIAMLPQVLSSLTFSSRQELEEICANALAISEVTPRSFKRDLYSVCYGGFTDAMMPFLNQLYECSSLQVYPEELVRNLLDRLAPKGVDKRMSILASIAHEDQLPSLYRSTSDNESSELKFIVLDCRPAEEYYKLHLSLSHHIDPRIIERPDDLDEVMQGFFHMKGCHFCIVGPSIEAPFVHPRSSFDSVYQETSVQLSRVDSNDNVSTQDHSQRSSKAAAGSEGSRKLPSSRRRVLSRKQSRGEPGALACEISSEGASKLHAEHASVTRLVLMFSQNGFKFVSRLDGGFGKLEKNIRSMDAFEQEQLLVSSPLPASMYEQEPEATCTGTTPPGGFNLFAKMGLNRPGTGSQEEPGLEPDTDAYDEVPSANRNCPSVSMGTTALIPLTPKGKEEKKKTKTTTSAVSTLSQRLMVLKAAAKDAVAHSITGTNAMDGWVEVRAITTDVEIQPGPIGISFRKSRASKKYQAAVDSLVPDSQAAAIGLINAGDLLIAINGNSLKNKSFLNVIKLIIEASRPVVLRFLTPASAHKDTTTASAIAIPPLAPKLISATKHSLCITWDRLSTSVASSGMVLYQLEFARHSNGVSDSWFPVAVKQDGATVVDTTGVTDQTSGTMVGLEPGESLVFRVRCGSGQRWGPYSVSSDSMKTTDVDAARSVSDIVTSTPMSPGALAGAIFLPGVCPRYVERGRFIYRVVLTLQARRRPNVNADKVDIILETGQVIVGSERLVCPGTKQAFVRLTFDSSDESDDQEREDEGGQGELRLLRDGQGEADGETDGVWAFESTPQGDVVLERLPESAIDEIEPLLQEQAKSLFASCHGDNGDMSSAGSTNSVTSTASSNSSVVRATGSSSHVPSSPHISEVFPASSSEVVVMWDPVNDSSVTKYQIQYVKDRLAAMWWTVKPDITAKTCQYVVAGLQPNTSYLFRIRSGTEDNKWSLFSESSESCRTLSSSAASVNSASSDEDGEPLNTRLTAISSENEEPSMSSATHSASMRTGGTILNRAVAAASRLKKRSPRSSPRANESSVNSKEDDDDGVPQQHEDNRTSELVLPESRYVNLAKWKSSWRNSHKDFRFYHVTKFEERDIDSKPQLSRLGHRELVVTPSLLVLLNVMVATREGFALVEEWRPLTSLLKVAARDGLNNALVFHFKDTLDSLDGVHSTNQLIVVVEGAEACAKVVQEYHAKTLDGRE